jgi:hypothetical protein
VRTFIQICRPSEIKCLFAMAALSITAVFSGKAQFSVSLSSVQDFPWNPPPIVNGYPVNYIYNFTVSGNFPPPAPPFDSVVEILMRITPSDGYLNTADANFSASNVGGPYLNDSPWQPGELYAFWDFYNGGPVQGSITIWTSDPIPGNWTWDTAELAQESDSGILLLAPIYSYSGLIAIPEPEQYELLGAAGLIILTIASSCRHRKKKAGRL